MSTMSTDDLYKLKAELTEKIRSEKDQKKREELIEQSRFVNSKIKALKVPSESQNNTNTTTTLKEKNMKQCKGCNNSYEGSKSNTKFVDIVYCPNCRKIRGKDIIELITVNDDKTFNVQYFSDENASIQQLEKMKIDVRLDLHKTLDTIPIDNVLPTKSVCCLSYVGNFTQTRIGARMEIIERIKSKQIQFGILVFKRGSKRDPDLCNRFHEVGSKAWVNKYLGKESENVIFIDDSDDHVYSVKSIDNSINSVKLTPNLKLVDVLEKILKK